MYFFVVLCKSMTFWKNKYPIYFFFFVEWPSISIESQCRMQYSVQCSAALAILGGGRVGYGCRAYRATNELMRLKNKQPVKAQGKDRVRHIHCKATKLKTAVLRSRLIWNSRYGIWNVQIHGELCWRRTVCKNMTLWMTYWLFLHWLEQWGIVCPHTATLYHNWAAVLSSGNAAWKLSILSLLLFVHVLSTLQLQFYF